MAVVIGNVRCLKFDKEDSKFYSRGAFLNDFINVWWKDGSQMRGQLTSLSGGSVTILCENGVRVSRPVDNIHSFEVVFRNNELIK